MRLAFMVVAVAACGTDIDVAPEHNPLGTTDSVLPFPSSLYEVADSTSPTGYHLDVPVNAFPGNADTGAPFDPTPLARRHGWSPATTILWTTPGGVDMAGLVPYTDIGASVMPASGTVIVDMTTGERVAHFAEVDANEFDHFDRQAIYLRLAQRLAGGHRYAVGIRNTLHRRDGGALERPAGFQAVLDNDTSSHARLDRAAPRIREAVAALETAGVPSSELVVAWDFMVNDDATTIADPLAARDAALVAIGDGGANLSYSVSTDMGTINADPRLVRRIELTFQSPALTGDGLAGYFRDASGKPMVQGTMTAKAYIMVPPCATSGAKAGVLIYGHGFFGNLDEIKQNEYIRDMMTTNGCLVAAGTEWTGMSKDDIPNALLALNNLSLGVGFGERIFQGVINTIALEQLMRGKLASELLTDAGGSVVDTTRTYFLGISMGHILGSVYTAYSPNVARSVLHVGAANWALMFERSKNWSVYGVPLKGAYKDLLEAVIMEQVLEMGMETADGASVAGIDIPNTPPKHILMQTSRNDAQVPNLAAYYQARSLGLSLITPSVVTPYGIPDVATTAEYTRAYQIVDEHPDPQPPADNEVFSFDNNAHENPRRRTLLQQQMEVFWTTGMVQHACGADPCDCTTGACGSLTQPMYGGN